jgi:hypothetical protein
MGSGPDQQEIFEAHLALFRQQRRELSDIHSTYGRTAAGIRAGDDRRMIERVRAIERAIEALEALISVYERR